MSGAGAPPESSARARGGPAPLRPAAAPAPRARGARRRWVVPLLALLLLLCALALAGQWSRNAALERQVEALTGEIGRTRQELQAHRSHLGEVRAQVGELGEGLAALEELLERGPTAAGVEVPGGSPD